MKDKGHKQGDMSPHIEEMQSPDKAYTQVDANKADEYIERTNKRLDKEASGVRKQGFVGRYD